MEDNASVQAVQDKGHYWTVRAAIEKAARSKDDETLTALAKIYPEIFRNMVNFIENQEKVPTQ